MEVAGYLLLYFAGVLTGAMGTITLTIAIGRRALLKKQKVSALPKVEPVAARMKKVKDITNEQLSIQAATLGPQKNSMHGRYKNGLIGRMKELEEQRTEILKSIIADGFDPEITTVDEVGVVTHIKLSQFLAQTGVVMSPKSGPTKAVSKFTIHKGGKDDGNGSTTH